MRKTIFLLLLSIFTSCHVFACEEPHMNYDELTRNAKAVYVGGIISVSIPDMQKEDFYADYNYPNEIRRNDRAIKMEVHHTLQGEQQEKLVARIDWCNGQEIKLGKMAILYQLNSGWYLKHDEFAISAATAMLTNHTDSIITNIASH